MKKKLTNKPGFSLIEAIFASAILIFVLGALVVLYVNFYKFYNRQQVEIKIGDSAREAAKELQSTVLQADQIKASHNFSGTTYTTGQHTVVLEIPSFDSSRNIVSGKYDYAVFYITGKNLYRLVEVDAASSRPSGLNQISDAVDTITFTYDNSDLSQASKIDTDLEMQEASSGQNVTYHLYQEIYLRNH
jgi:Tfp pilus assembly protein PilW